MGRNLPRPPAIRRLEHLYRAHHRRVRWVLRSRGIHGDELDDVVHDVFLAVHRRYDTRNPSLGIEAWITGVARNVAFSFRRGHARRRSTEQAVPEPTPQLLPDETIAQHQAWRALEDFLTTLDDEQRETFVLMALLGMPTAEVAKLTETPANTVSSRLRLARRRFDKRFAALRGHEAALLAAAGVGERPTPDARRRSMNRVLAAVPLRPLLAATAPAVGAITAKAVATTVAIAAVTLVGITWVNTPSAERSPRAKFASTVASVEQPVVGPATSSPTTTSPSAPTMQPVVTTPLAVKRPLRETPRDRLTARPSGPVVTMAAAAAQAGPESKVQPAPVPVDATALAAAIALLRDAEAQLVAGNARDALATIDSFAERFPTGPLQRDRLRIERRAACAGGDQQRAASAHRQLQRQQLVSSQAPTCP